MNFDKESISRNKKEGGGRGGGGGKDMITRAAIFYIQDTLSRPIQHNHIVS